MMTTLQDWTRYGMLIAMCWSTLAGATELPVRISGTVSVAGQPAAGARITLRHTDSAIATTVYSDRSGHYNVALERDGTYEISASWTTYASAPVPQLLTSGAAHTFEPALLPDPDYRQRVTSEQWLSLLPDGDMKREFLLNCTSCHEIDAARILVDGAPRSAAQWDAAFALMRAIDQYKLLPEDFDDKKYTAWLAQHLDRDASARLSPPVPHKVDALEGIRITEYPLPEATELPHDLVVGPQGRIWITAFFSDVIWALDPATGAIETYALRADDAPGWGQARALVFAPDGTLWVVLGGTHELVALDPASRKFETYNVGMYAHSLVLDSQGRVWFNDYFAVNERIGVFDPATKDVRHINIPSAGLTPQQGLPLPYGLQIDSAGRLYSTQLAGNTLVMYDTNTAAAELITMPVANAGPRRPAIGADDVVWVPEWNTGFLSGYDPASNAFKRYRIGSAALGAYDAEYDPRSGRVWITGALGASMIAFDPRDESVLEIPLPTNPAYTRHLAVDPASGDLWSAYSSLPAAQPKVVRIQQR